MNVNSPFFPRLFEPGHIGKMTIRNRIVMPSMGTGLSSATGEVTDVLLDYYEARARGGTGLVIAGNACIDSRTGKSSVHQPCADDDRFLPGLTRLAEVIKKHGACAAVQLHHAGGSAQGVLEQPVGPSKVGKPGSAPTRALSHDEIQGIVESYASAAERLRLSGFDGAEIMAARGYLLSAFLSDTYNKRQDEYGGTVRNRARLLVQIIQAIKKRAGSDFPIWVRIDGREFRIENGITLEESRQFALLAREAGADAIHVVAGDYRPAHAMHWRVDGQVLPPSAHPAGFLLPLAAEIKKAVDIPVIGVGRITPQVAESALETGMVDFVAMGRTLIADPDLPNKASEGRLNDIIPCIACLVCRDQPIAGKPIRCSANPVSGKERQFISNRATKPRTVVVVGGGPAGMQAALAAARRGHKVTLFDEEQELGGQLRLACIPTHKSVITNLTNYFVRQLTEQGVRIVPGHAASATAVITEHPDVVVLASGSRPTVPRIPGIDNRKVMPASAALTNPGAVGKKVVIIGGGLVGCETAEFLADDGRSVTIIEMRSEIAIGVGPSTRPLLLERLALGGVVSYCDVRCDKVEDSGVTISGKGIAAEVIEADSIVLATGAAPNRDLAKALEGQPFDVHMAGDCVEPRCIADAVEDGARIGLKI